MHFKEAFPVFLKLFHQQIQIEQQRRSQALIRPSKHGKHCNARKGTSITKFQYYSSSLILNILLTAIFSHTCSEEYSPITFICKFKIPYCVFLCLSTLVLWVILLSSLPLRPKFLSSKFRYKTNMFITMRV